MFSVTKSAIFVEDKCYGFIGGAIRSFSGNDVSVVNKVKSKPLQGALDNSLLDFKNLRTSGQQALGDYISNYLSRASDAKRFGAEEEGAVSDFFNGTLSNRLAQLRASRSAAVNKAADVGALEGIRAARGNALANEGGTSSYDTRSAISAVAPIRAQAAVDNANQERADLGFITQGQMDNIGRRNDIINRTAGFGLVPESAKRSMFAQNEGFLGNLLQADQLNHFYGLKQDTNQWADFADSADQGILNAASIFSSVAGGGMKDGGLVRRNYVTGGEVEGPGTGTSDSIPIRVSDGEFIMPAKAVKMPGVLPLLEHIRQMALKDSTASKKSGGKDGRHFFAGGSTGSMDLGFGAGSMYTGNWMSEGSNPDSFGSQFTVEEKQVINPQPQKKTQKSSGGGGGGGLSGAASGLQARVDRNLMAQWFPSSSTFGTEAAPEFNAPGANAPWFMNTDQEGVLA